MHAIFNRWFSNNLSILPPLWGMIQDQIDSSTYIRANFYRLRLFFSWDLIWTIFIHIQIFQSLNLNNLNWFWTNFGITNKLSKINLPSYFLNGCLRRALTLTRIMIKIYCLEIERQISAAFILQSTPSVTFVISAWLFWRALPSAFDLNPLN